MSYDCSRGIITPAIPNELLFGLEGWALGHMLGHEPDGDNETYFYEEEGTSGHWDDDDSVLPAMLAAAAPDDPMRLKIEAMIKAEGGIPDGGGPVNTFIDDIIGVEFVLQRILVKAAGASFKGTRAAELVAFEYEGCIFSSRLSPGANGGWASFITATSIQVNGTGAWLRQQREANQTKATRADLVAMLSRLCDAFSLTDEMLDNLSANPSEMTEDEKDYQAQHYAVLKEARAMLRGQHEPAKVA